MQGTSFQSTSSALIRMMCACDGVRKARSPRNLACICVRSSTSPHDCEPRWGKMPIMKVCRICPPRQSSARYVPVPLAVDRRLIELHWPDGFAAA
eukprot:4094402-Prymnesium_polylepis.1